MKWSRSFRNRIARRAEDSGCFPRRPVRSPRAAAFRSFSLNGSAISASRDLIAALQPDLGVVAAYGRILPDALLAVPRYGMINVHASILPAYRGAAPVHRAVIAGERETGVTIMRVVRELDAGPTFAIARRAIGPDETSEDVERGLAELGAALLLDVVRR